RRVPHDAHARACSERVGPRRRGSARQPHPPGFAAGGSPRELGRGLRDRQSWALDVPLPRAAACGDGDERDDRVRGRHHPVRHWPALGDRAGVAMSESGLLPFLLIAAALANGLIAGTSLDRSVVQLPARHKIGVAAYSAYSVAHELEGVGIVWYPVLGIGSA